MRLIDADAFIASLNEYIDKPMTAGLCATLVELQPTAYDVDEVVKEAKEISLTWLGEVRTCNVIKTIRKGGVK